MRWSLRQKMAFIDLFSLAATMGARFRYQPTGQWSASLAGSYQPSLGPVTQASSQVQSRPTTAGMTFGVDYHF